MILKWLFDTYTDKFEQWVIERNAPDLPEKVFKNNADKLIELAFKHKHKPQGDYNMSKVFVDKKGNQYYIFDTVDDIPLARKAHIESLAHQLYSCLTFEELQNLFKEIKRCLNKGTDPDIVKIGWMAEEMETRNNLLLREDLMFEVVAAEYIRHDENPAFVDREIEAEKLKQFKEDSKDGLYDFFYKPILRKYFPALTISQGELIQYLTRSKNQIANFNGMLNTSEQKLSESVS